MTPKPTKTLADAELENRAELALENCMKLTRIAPMSLVDPVLTAIIALHSYALGLEEKVRKQQERIVLIDELEKEAKTF